MSSAATYMPRPYALKVMEETQRTPLPSSSYWVCLLYTSREVKTNESYSHGNTDLKTLKALENLENVTIPEPERTVPKVIDDTAIFKKRSVEEIIEKETASSPKKVKVVEETTVENGKELIVEKAVSQIKEEQKSVKDSEDEEQEEFEIPAIELSDDEEEELSLIHI